MDTYNPFRQTGKATAIRRIAVRDTGVSRNKWTHLSSPSPPRDYHSTIVLRGLKGRLLYGSESWGLVWAPPWDPHSDIVFRSLRRALTWVPIMPGDDSVSEDSYSYVFQFGPLFIVMKKLFFFIILFIVENIAYPCSYRRVRLSLFYTL